MPEIVDMGYIDIAKSGVFVLWFLNDCSSRKKDNSDAVSLVVNDQGVFVGGPNAIPSRPSTIGTRKPRSLLINTTITNSSS